MPGQVCPPAGPARIRHRVFRVGHTELGSGRRMAEHEPGFFRSGCREEASVHLAPAAEAGSAVRLHIPRCDLLPDGDDHTYDLGVLDQLPQVEHHLACTSLGRPCQLPGPPYRGPLLDLAAQHGCLHGRRCAGGAGARAHGRAPFEHQAARTGYFPASLLPARCNAPLHLSRDMAVDISPPCRAP